MASGRFKLLGFVIRIAVVGIILSFVAMKTDLCALLALVRDSALLPLLGGVVLFGVNRILGAIKWDVLLRQNGIKAGLPFLTRTMFVSAFLGSIIPSGLGIDLIRLVEVGRNQKNFTASAGSVLVDRLLAIAALACLSVLASIKVWSIIEDKFVLEIVMGCSVLLVVMIFSMMSKVFFRFYSYLLGVGFRIAIAFNLMEAERADRMLSKSRIKLNEIYASFAALVRKPRVFMQIFMLNVLVQMVRITKIHLCFMAVGVTVPLLYEAAFVPIIILLTLLPVSPFMGIGVKEGAFLYFFSKVGVLPEAAVSVSLLSHVVNLAGLIPGAVLFFSTKRGRPSA